MSDVGPPPGGDQLFLWRDGSLLPADPTAPTTRTRLSLADSWLLSDGRVRRIDLHRQRFLRGCAEVGSVSQETSSAFWQAALGQLPRAGDWFPRVELSAEEPVELRVRVRPSPARSGTVSVWVSDTADPRTAARLKGPDLDALGALRGRAAERGAQEALLTTESGVVLEAGFASVLWWDGDRLCVPSPELPVLGGVTTAVIQERAARLGVPIGQRQVPVEELEGKEVWLVNALHGIRPVRSWVGTSMRPGPAHRAPAWQKWLAGESTEVRG
ncbi:aminotransferase class IV [Streptomyces lydicus]|uniref:aminotransferase class IV n=1 Tax=Streptomyces lydicus TaxID=47763 RepID=UPI001F50D5C9|nr:aminotransferase class IV [Streptomyces lydicus]